MSNLSRFTDIRYKKCQKCKKHRVDIYYLEFGVTYQFCEECSKEVSELPVGKIKHYIRSKPPIIDERIR